MYAIWRACVRVGIRPPGIKPSWDENGVDAQAMVLSFDRLVDHDDTERDIKLAGVKMPFSPTGKKKRR